MKEKKSFWETGVGSILKKVAPSAIDLVGDVVPGGKLLKTIFNTEIEQSNLSAVEKEEARLDFEKALKEYELREREMILHDRANARDMQKAALAQGDNFSKRFIYYFAAFWSLFSTVYIFWVTFGTVPEANTRFADTVLGFLLATIVGTIIAYFYGSSDGSKKKDEARASL